jgi:hypothetical protein
LTDSTLRSFGRSSNGIVRNAIEKFSLCPNTRSHGFHDYFPRWPRCCYGC